MRRITPRLLIWISLVGCADVRGGQSPSEAERVAATELSAQIRALQVLAKRPNQSQTLVSTAALAPLLSLVAPDTPRVHTKSTVGGRYLSRCLTRTATTATYTECEVGEHVVHGSMSAIRDRIQAELVDVFILGTSEHGTVTLDARLSRGSTMTGAVELDALWTVGEREHVLDADLQVDGLGFDETGCATSGSITIQSDLSLPPAPGSSRTSRTLWFGPQCGEVLVSR